MTHSHAFLPVDRFRLKFRCACGVYGYRKGSRIAPMTCSMTVGHKRCGAEAIVIGGDRSRSKCGEHAEREAA